MIQITRINSDNSNNFDDALIIERDKEIKEILHDVSEVNELFQTVSLLINSQAQDVDNIKTNIQKASNNCKEAVNSLEQAEVEDNSNYKLILGGIGAGVCTISTVITLIFLL
jgi:t-SNARE complex subunit (syntaxin)